MRNIFFSLSVVFATFSYYAAGSSERFLAPAELFKQSSLVFEGEVTEVRYKNSAPDQGSPKGQPFTFVTYRVITPIRGQVGNMFTLRFWGGVSTDETYMSVGNIPDFDVGERDVLFVKRNSVLACPLAGCEAGRFRIVGEKVFTNHGRTLRFRNGKTVSPGAPQKINEVVEHNIKSPVSGKTVQMKLDGVSAATPAAEPDQFRAVEFLAYLKKTAAAVSGPSSVEASANFANPPTSYVLKPKAPKQPAAVNEPAGTAADQAEMKSYLANSENPVFPKKP